MNRVYFLAGRFQYHSLFSMTRMSKKAKINGPFTLSQEGQACQIALFIILTKKNKEKHNVRKN
jgi:hypothetical protein